MAAEIDAAGHRDERSARHPVRCRRHAVEHGGNLTAGHVVGLDLHGPRQPADAGIDEHGKGDEQDTDGIGAHPQLLQDRHQDDEGDKTACVHPVDLGQIIDKGVFHCFSPCPLFRFVFGDAEFFIDFLLGVRQIENLKDEDDQ